MPKRVKMLTDYRHFFKAGEEVVVYLPGETVAEEHHHPGGYISKRKADVLVDLGRAEWIGDGPVEEAAKEDSLPDELMQIRNDKGAPSTKWLRDELVAYAEYLGLDADGTKREILDAIREAERVDG